MDNALTLNDYPPELQRAYNDPAGDIMWRAGIARASAILMRKPRGDIKTIISLLRDSVRHPDDNALMNDAAIVISRIPKAITELQEMIDGGEECRGRDSQISSIINILEGLSA